MARASGQVAGVEWRRLPINPGRWVVKYPGGKGGCFRQIINLMPPHDVYIETHLGGANVMENKKPASCSIGIDVDRSVIDAHDGRLPGVELHCIDAVNFLKSYLFTGRELVYADPPYLMETRKGGPLYRHEYTDEQHKQLLSVLVTLPCIVMISGYRSSLYTTMLQGWSLVEFTTGSRQGKVTECVWTNFIPGTLPMHDVSYVGRDFRERERIKRKCHRWVSRFKAMAPGERQAIFESLLVEYDDIKGSHGKAPLEIGAPGGSDAHRFGESTV